MAAGLFVTRIVLHAQLTHVDLELEIARLGSQWRAHAGAGMGARRLNCGGGAVARTRWGGLGAQGRLPPGFNQFGPHISLSSLRIVVVVVVVGVVSSSGRRSSSRSSRSSGHSSSQ